MKSLFAAVFALLASAAVPAMLRANEDEPPRFELRRPLLTIINDLPVAYLLGVGQVEGCYSFPTANKNVDPFGVVKKAEVDGLRPSQGNPGYPHGITGKTVLLNLGVSDRINLLIDISRKGLNYTGGSVVIDNLRYGAKMNLLPETETYPAVTAEYDYVRQKTIVPLDATSHRVMVHASKRLNDRYLLHGTLGWWHSSVAALSIDSPPPELGGDIRSQDYTMNTYQTGMALTWQSGLRTDITFGAEHFGFGRTIDSMIPGGLSGSNRVYLFMCHAIKDSFIVHFRLDRRSDQNLEWVPFFYNSRSLGSFNEEFGWIEVGFTLRGDLTL
jgi:hypothetical protein